MSYRDRFFARYISTHIADREGTLDLAEFQRREPYYRAQIGWLLPADRAARVADVGCGNGSLVWFLQRAGYRNVEGVDVSLEQIEAARRLGLSNLQQADLRSFLAGKSDAFDLIIMRDVLEHFSKEEVLDVLELSYIALRPRGRLLIQVPNAEAPFFGRIRYGDFTHELAFSISSLQQLFRVAGLADVRCYPTQPVFLGAMALPRRLLWKLTEAFYQLLLFAELGRGQRIVTQGIIAVGVRPAHNGVS